MVELGQAVVVVVLVVVVVVVIVVVVVVVVVVVSSSGGGCGGSSSRSKLIQCTGKHDKNHETDNETHTHTPRTYILMYQNVLNHRK
jgi:hypothetical protein